MNRIIGRPDFDRIVVPMRRAEDVISDLNRWFEQSVKPVNKILAESVFVQGTGDGVWSDPCRQRIMDPDDIKYEGYLINIKEAGAESELETLRSRVEELESALREVTLGAYN